ncbi:HAD family hydrolase [Brevibacillus ginsengisoli]|uniref:HAD family hydrolase n=1 Tax=Brevibacillus ginsengisoli TaxID=363854 RepID=UPI003CF916BC
MMNSKWMGWMRMTVKVKAIALDMDGTMLNEDNQVNDSLSDYLLELRRRGLLVFIATGRTLWEVKEILPDGLQVDGVVTANGMGVFAGEQQLVQHSLAPQLIEELIGRARSKQIYYEVHPADGGPIALREDEAYFPSHVISPRPESVGESEWMSRLQAIREEINWCDSLAGHKVAKIYFFSRDQEQITEWRRELSVLQQQSDFAMFPSSDHNVEIMVANVSKATGVQYLLQYFGLEPADVLAVGDSENDLPLFQFAGHAVAMRNAPDRVKHQADDVTEFTNQEDGLTRYLVQKFGR